jgi:hypothetical protein
VSAQKAQIAAIKAYNQRVRKIGTLQGDIKAGALAAAATSGLKAAQAR